MALCKRKPRAVLEHIVSQFELLKQNRSALSSSINAPKSAASSPSSTLSKLIGDPRAGWANRTSPSSRRRFESTIAENLGIEVAKGTFNHQLLECNIATLLYNLFLGRPQKAQLSILIKNLDFTLWWGLANLPDVRFGQIMDFPGGKVAFTPKMSFISESPEERAHCYRVLDEDGQPLAHSSFIQVSEQVAIRMYSEMVTLQTMDNIFYEAQRQGRISFYVTSIGEEAINIASAAALTFDDLVFPQYREPGVLIWRGFTLQEFANQCFGNKADYGKGRQMPVHYGSNKLNYFTVSSTIATQIPHAVGAAYSLKMDKKDACVVTYFGDGGSSEGDFHAAINFAAVREAPVIFICRNNGWAISTPTSDQFRSDGIVVKGPAYGVRSIRVDGNDALAMYSSVRAAREMAISEQRPILIEALTYRAGHHSTSDDSTKYRPANEIEWWQTARDPVSRLRKWIESNGWWSEEAESELRSNVRKQLLHAIQVAERVEKPPISDLFTDVYDVPPSNLQEQEMLLRETIKRYPQDYPGDVPV